MTADPLWQRIPLQHRFEGTAIGLGLRVDTNSLLVLDLVAGAFGRFAPMRGRIDIAVEAVVGGVESGGLEGGGFDSRDGGGMAGRRSARDPDPAGATPAAPRLFHRERGALYTAGDDRGSVVVADLAGGRAAAFVDPTTPPEVVRTVLLESPIWRIAAWRGLIALHAAAVLVDGRTVILRGLGGAGKSSLTYAAARAGHAVLAEEVVWFDPTGPEPVLRGAPWTLHLEPEAADLFPELRDREIVRRSAGSPKIAIDIERDLGGACVEAAALGPMVFLDRWSDQASGKPKTTCDRLSDELARDRFDATLLAAETTQERSRIEAARDALAARGAWEIRVGDIGHGVRMIEEIARGW